MTMREVQLLGSWGTDPLDSDAIERDGKALIEFKPDGSMIYSIDVGDKYEQMFLTFRTDNGMIITNQPSAPREDRTAYDLTPDGKLILDYGGTRTRYVRLG